MNRTKIALGALCFALGFLATPAFVFAQFLPHVPEGCSYAIPGTYIFRIGLTRCDDGNCPESFPAETIHTEDPDHPSEGEICSHAEGYNPVISVQSLGGERKCVLSWNRSCDVDGFGHVAGSIYMTQPWVSPDQSRTSFDWEGSYSVSFTAFDGSPQGDFQGAYEAVGEARQDSPIVVDARPSQTYAIGDICEPTTASRCEWAQARAAREYFTQFLLGNEQACADWCFSGDNMQWLVYFNTCPGPVLEDTWMVQADRKTALTYTWFSSDFANGPGVSFLTCSCSEDGAGITECHTGL